MINESMLINSAKQAQGEESNIFLVYDNGFKIIVDNSKCSDDFFRKYNYTYNDLLQAFTPDMILKYDTANYNQGTMSIDTFLEIVKNEYKS